MRIEARNASWGSFFKGKTATLEKAFAARLTPPRLEVLTAQHYVNQGGCDMVVYRVTPEGVETGVQAGEAWFKGFALPGATDPSLRFAIFAFPYDARPDAGVRLKARDEAANEAVASFSLKVFPKAFRTRTLTIDPLLYSTLFGSTGSENGNAVAIDSMDNAYIAGFTSGGTGGDLPVTPGAYQLSNAGSGDGFVAKFNPNASGAASRLRCFVEANPL